MLIKSMIVIAKAPFMKEKTLFTGKLEISLRNKLVKCCIWSIALYGAEIWTLWSADQNYLENFEVWCWRRMEKISWIDRVKNEELLHETRRRGLSYIKEKGGLTGLSHLA
jgi:hypothetical protein